MTFTCDGDVRRAAHAAGDVLGDALVAPVVGADHRRQRRGPVVAVLALDDDAPRRDERPEVLAEADGGVRHAGHAALEPAGVM